MFKTMRWSVRGEGMWSAGVWKPVEKRSYNGVWESMGYVESRCVGACEDEGVWKHVEMRACGRVWSTGAGCGLGRGRGHWAWGDAT